MVISNSRSVLLDSWVAACARANVVFRDSNSYIQLGLFSWILLFTPFSGTFAPKDSAFLFAVGHPGTRHDRTGQPRRSPRREPLYPTLPPGTELAGGSAPGGDATVKATPGAARRVA